MAILQRSRMLVFYHLVQSLIFKSFIFVFW